ncbi:MAG: hypothetical protein PVI82_11930 [Desulfobacterales bacterium]|jgi:hypothetical protein
MHLNANWQGNLSTKSIEVDEKKCACCRRELKSSAEWIRGKKYMICDSCYRSLLYPEMNPYNQENI